MTLLYNASTLNIPVLRRVCKAVDLQVFVNKHPLGNLGKIPVYTKIDQNSEVEL